MGHLCIPVTVGLSPKPPPEHCQPSLLRFFRHFRLADLIALSVGPGAAGRPPVTSVACRAGLLWIACQSRQGGPASILPPQRGRATTATRTIPTIVLEQGFEGVRLNTGTMSDLETLARRILANYRTIRLPAEALPARPNLQPSDWGPLVKARRAEKRVLYNLRDGVRRVLNQHRYRFIDCQERDPDGGWRLHIFALDENALPFLDGIDGRRCEPGDPLDFDPEEFVIERLRELDWFEP
jgi:hypothetical protein